MLAMNWYLLPHELTHPEDDQEVIREGLSASTLAEALKSIPAQKMLLLDARHADGALAAFCGIENRKACSNWRVPQAYTSLLPLQKTNKALSSRNWATGFSPMWR
jgi:hypothetical protein